MTTIRRRSRSHQRNCGRGPSVVRRCRRTTRPLPRLRSAATDACRVSARSCQRIVALPSDPHSSTAPRSWPRGRRRSSCTCNRLPQLSHQLGHTARRMRSLLLRHADGARRFRLCRRRHGLSLAAHLVQAVSFRRAGGDGTSAHTSPHGHSAGCWGRAMVGPDVPGRAVARLIAEHAVSQALKAVASISPLSAERKGRAASECEPSA